MSTLDSRGAENETKVDGSKRSKRWSLKDGVSGLLKI